MDASTTAKMTRAEQCRSNARSRSEQKRQAAFEALSALQQERRSITKAAVARRAGVSVVFLRNHSDLVQAIEDAEQARPAMRSPLSSSDQVKDQVIAALRRRLDEMKQRLAAKDAELRQKQRDIDRLYGKLAAVSPLTNAELRSTLAEALARLAQCAEVHPADPE
jgi:tRNA U34 5-carboxymethylaminomethyl modifying GTPase MnmE/TrmE